MLLLLVTIFKILEVICRLPLSEILVYFLNDHMASFFPASQFSYIMVVVVFCQINILYCHGLYCHANMSHSYNMP